MIRIILSFAAGFVIAKLTTESKAVEDIKATSCKVAEKLQKTSKKVAGVVREEFNCKDKEGEKTKVISKAEVA